MQAFPSITLVWISSCIVITAQADDAEKYTSEQLNKINQLREYTSDSLDSDYMKTDGYMARWLTVKNWNLRDAQEMLKQNLEWRKANNLKNILNEVPIPELARVPFYTIEHHDLEGRPIVLIDMKRYDIRKYAVAGHAKQFKRVSLQMFEKTEHAIHAANSGRNATVSQGISMQNMHSFNTRQHACFACFPYMFELTGNYERNHPGIFKHVYLVNTPRAFSTLFDLLKPLLSKTSAETLSVYGVQKQEWLPKLLTKISEDQLPETISGKRKTN